MNFIGLNLSIFNWKTLEVNFKLSENVSKLISLQYPTQTLVFIL